MSNKIHKYYIVTAIDIILNNISSPQLNDYISHGLTVSEIDLIKASDTDIVSIINSHNIHTIISCINNLYHIE